MLDKIYCVNKGSGTLLSNKINKLSALLILAFCILLVTCLTACGDGGGSATADGDQTAVSEEETASDSNSAGQTSDGEKETSEAGNIDVDLTTLSSTMVYSEVNDMMVYPEKYKDKTIKMTGIYTAFHDENTNKSYYACIIEDATACCKQGIEFELTEDYKYPDDYPKEDDQVTVVGTFDTYKEGDATYCVLKNAELYK